MQPIGLRELAGRDPDYPPHAHPARRLEPVLLPRHLLSGVYKHDQVAKEQNMTDEERLRFHRENSSPLMAELNIWRNDQLDQKTVEPNSGLGQAVNDMLRHWDALTLFPRDPGAPLDNNIRPEHACRKDTNFRNPGGFWPPSS